MPTRIPTPGVPTPPVRSSKSAQPAAKPSTLQAKQDAALNKLMKSRVKNGVYDSGRGN